MFFPYLNTNQLEYYYFLACFRTTVQRQSWTTLMNSRLLYHDIFFSFDKLRHINYSSCLSSWNTTWQKLNKHLLFFGKIISYLSYVSLWCRTRGAASPAKRMPSSIWPFISARMTRIEFERIQIGTVHYLFKIRVINCREKKLDRTLNTHLTKGALQHLDGPVGYQVGALNIKQTSSTICLFGHWAGKTGFSCDQKGCKVHQEYYTSK